MKKFFTLIAVAVMAFAAQANVLTLADGLYHTNVLPICGLYADTYGSQTQVIYSADLLAEIAGGKITSVTFYTDADYYINNGIAEDAESDDYINFDNAKFELSFLEVDENGYDENSPVAIEGATAVATVVPVRGDYMVTFVLDEPFAYTGKNLLVDIKVIEEGSWGQTYFLGDDASSYVSYYDIDGSVAASQFMPKTTFAYEAGQTGAKTDAPSSHKENFVFNDGNIYYNAYTVTLIPTEESDIYYRIGLMDTETGQYIYGDWMLYEEPFEVTEAGTYMVEAYAIAPGKTESDHIWDGFTVSQAVSVEELFAGKEVANVRYFNVAGQQMQQPAGLTIQVTTYTDGTTSTVKVVK